MTDYLNPTTRVGGVKQIVVADRATTIPVDDAPFDDEQYVRVNGEWVPYNAPPIIPDTLAPKPPATLGSSGAMGANGASVDYTLSWDAPTQNTDDSPLTDFAYYVVRWRYGVGGAYQAFTTKDTTFLLTGLKPATDVQWQVLARDTSGNDSSWASNTITGLADTTGPVKPSTPVLSSRLGTISVTWDGLDNVGSPPPADFSHLDIFVSATSGGPWTLLDKLSGAGRRITTDVRVGDVRYFSFIAVDSSGNLSLRSTEASIEVTGITGPDIEANSVTANEIDAGYVYTGSLLADQIRGGYITSDITISGSFSTAVTGQRSVMDGFGIRQFGPDGTSIITDMPNEGNPRFSGIVNAFGLIVNGGLEFRGQNNLFAMGSVVTMATTTGGSAIPPAITPSWETVDSGMTEYLYVQTGHHREADGGNAVWQCQFFGYGHIHNGPYKYTWPEITFADGNKAGSRLASSSTVVRTATGPRMVSFVDKRTNGQQNSVAAAVRGIEVYDLSPMTANEIPPTIKYFQQYGAGYNWWYVGVLIGRCFSPVGSSTLENQIALVEHKQDVNPDQLYLKRYLISDTAVTQQGSTVQVASPIDGNPNEAILGVNYGSSGKMMFPGAEQNVWVVFTREKAVVYSATGTRLPDLDFPLAPDAERVDAVGSTAAGANGFVRFESVARNNPNSLPATRYTNIHWDSTDSSVWWATYTWRDSVGTVHESDMAALSSVTMPKRMRYTLTAPNLPDPAAGAGTTPAVDDVNGVYFYMGRGATKPLRTGMWKQSAQPADGAIAITYSSLPQFSGTSNPPLTTNFPSQAASKFQSSAVGADGLPKVLITGDGLLHGESLDVSGAGASALTGKAFEQLYYSIRAQSLLNGGGVITVSSTYEVKWSARLMVISSGRGANTTTIGYFNIEVPAVGTVIPGYGGETNKTVNANGIPLNAWNALWYELPYGSGSTSLPGNFRITGYSSDFTVPNNWVLICIRQGDANRVEFTTGDKLLPGQDNSLYLSSASAMTAAANWTVNTQSCARVGRTVQYYFIATRNNTAITSNATGDIGNVSIATIDVDWRPVQPINMSGAIANGGLWGGYINSSGTLTLSALQANVNLAVGAQISGSGTGLIA